MLAHHSSTVVPSSTVLLALPNRLFANTIAALLRRHGYQTLVATTATEAVRLAEQTRLALVICDALLPLAAGKGVLAWIREQPRHGQVPALILTPTLLTGNEPNGLDTLLAKPIALDDLLTMIRKLARGSVPANYHEALLTIGSITLDLDSFTLSGPSAAVILTPMEFRLLRFLAARPGVPYTTIELVREHWPGHVIGGVELLRVHVRNLRKKLARAAGHQATYIRTVPRVGYMFSESGTDDQATTRVEAR